MQKLMGMKGVQFLTIDQCEYGLKSREHHGDAPAMKMTRLITNLKLASTVLSTPWASGSGTDVSPVTVRGLRGGIATGAQLRQGEHVPGDG